MRTISLVCCLFLLGGNAYTQNSEETLFNRKNIRLSGVWLGSSYQFANFYEQDWTPLRGSTFGFEFNREFYLGWSRFSSREQIELAPADPSYSFSYNGLVIGVSPSATRWIHPRFGLTAGPAKLWRNTEEGADRLFIFQPQLGLEFNVFQFARVGLEGGYRFANKSNTYQLRGEDIAAPFIQVELRFGFSWANEQ